MDEKEIKKRIAKLKKECIEDVDNAFNEYILMDYYDAGLQSLDYIIDDDSYYGFWLHKAFSINRLLPEIADIEDEDLMDSLFLDLISIKKVVDRKLLDLKDLDTIYHDLGIDKKTQHRIEFNTQKLDKDKVINILHTGLTDEGLIQTVLPEFTPHFVHCQEDLKPIIWHGTVVQLVALFSRLYDKRLLTSSKSNSVEQIILNHFIQQNNKPFNQGSIRVNKTNLSTQDDAYPEINKIIGSLEA